MQKLSQALITRRLNENVSGEAAFNDEEVAALERILEPEAVGAQG
ncbi:MAG: hypothetical protein ACYTF3_06760 [Planctomycetota bacterium]|jgi:hypothetical protein